MWIVPAALAAAVLIRALIAVYHRRRRITREKAYRKIERLLDRTVGKRGDPLHGVLLIDAPRLGIDRLWAQGPAYADAAHPMDAEVPFLAASVGKLFVAAAVLDLVNEGVVTLEDPVDRWLPREVIVGLPVVGGDDVAATITVAQLMGHRSGLPDYFNGRTHDGAPNLATLLVTEPNRRWSAGEIIQYTKMHFAPHGRPGESFCYADTNYDLLSIVIEQATNIAWTQVVRRRVLQPLGLDRGWYHAFEAAPRESPRVADALINDTVVTMFESLSMDGAGGGLVTTVAILRDFLRGLQAGTPQPPEAFYELLTKNAIARGIDYGFGLWRIRPSGFTLPMRGLPDMVGVSGSLGSFVYLVPELDAVIAGTFDSSRFRAKHVFFLVRLIATLRSVGDPGGPPGSP